MRLFRNACVLFSPSSNNLSVCCVLGCLLFAVAALLVFYYYRISLVLARSVIFLRRSTYVESLDGITVFDKY